MVFRLLGTTTVLRVSKISGVMDLLDPVGARGWSVSRILGIAEKTCANQSYCTLCFGFYKLQGI